MFDSHFTSIDMKLQVMKFSLLLTQGNNSPFDFIGVDGFLIFYFCRKVVPVTNDSDSEGIPANVCTKYPRRSR